MTDSLLGEHWTRASNVIVRKTTEPLHDEFSPHSDVQLADFQLEPPREERRKSRRISSLREKSEQDLLELRRASQIESESPMSSDQVQKPVTKVRKSKEKNDAGKSVKVTNISNMREQIEKTPANDNDLKIRSLKRNDPEMLHLGFQEAMDEARRLQAEAVIAKDEVRRLKRAVARARSARGPRGRGQSPGAKPKPLKPVTLPTIVVSSE